MKMHENMEEQLWEYIDGTCSEPDKLFIEELIASNLAWKEKYQELLELHQVMQQHVELDEPSMRFARNVMEEIGKYHIAPAAKSYINKRVIWGIASFFLLSLLGFLIYTASQVQWAQVGSGSLSTVNMGKMDPGKIDFSKLANNTYTNIFIMINVVLGLVLLDMYLGRKKKQISNR